MDLENIVQQILLTRRDLTRDEVLKKIYEKKRSADDYFLDEVAARIVAVELGVEIENEQEPFQSEIAIKDLVSGLNNVTIIGRVTAIYPAQTFSRNDATQGKVARLLLTDGTGTLKLVLWDNDVELIETGQVQRGQILKVLHGYVRESFDGKLELHLGKRAEVEISPKGVDESRFPHTADFIEKIKQITPAKRRASVQGLVVNAFPTSEFKRKDGTNGKVKRLRLRDETGEITTVFWNEKVDELHTISEGDQLRITNTRVKQGLDGRLELHVENSSQIEKTATQKTPNQPALDKTPHKIVNLTEGSSFTIEGIVASTPLIREVTTFKGENVLLATFDLADETGETPVTLWRNHAEFARQLALGTRIRMENAYTKKGFSNPLEVTSRSTTTIEILAQPEAETEQTENKIE